MVTMKWTITSIFWLDFIAVIGEGLGGQREGFGGLEYFGAELQGLFGKVGS
jgi:hypothetical protein